MKKLIEFFVEQHLFGVLLAIFTIIIGVAALFQIDRERFPNVSYDVITVATTYPGSPAEEVEKLITNPLEQDIKEMDGIKTMSSHSVSNQSIITLQLDPNDTTEDEAKSDLRDIVDRFKPDLPDGAEDPIISAWESKHEGLIEIHVLGNLPPIELRNAAKKVKDELEDIEGVARVEGDGLQDLEIRVETNLNKLARYQLSLNDLFEALKKQNTSVPGGTIDASEENQTAEFLVRTSGQFENIDQIKNTVIRANDLGQAIRVADVAKVFNDLEESSRIKHTNGEPSIALRLLKKERGDAISIVDAIKKELPRIQKLVPEGVTLVDVNDVSFYIRRRLGILRNNLMVGLVLVSVLLSLLLPWKVALLVAVGIPFSFLGTMVYFYSAGHTLNLISLIGFIIVSGMLVDDAIVVTDNCVREIQEGKRSIKEAAVRGAHMIWQPVTASVLTTIVVFLPLMYMSGIFGKFVKQIPLAVIAALLISLVEAFFILPGHVAYWLRQKKQKEGAPEVPTKKGRFIEFWETKVTPVYGNIVASVIRLRVLTMGVGVVILIVTGFVAYKMPLVLFPRKDIEIFMIRTQGETGVSLKTTEKLMKPIEDMVKALPKHEVKYFYTTVGMHRRGLEVLRRGSEFAELWIFLTEREARDRKSADIIDSLREQVKDTPGFKRIIFEQLNPGPPTGQAISLGVRANEYEDIMPAVKHLKKILGEKEGVTDLSDTYILGKEELMVRVRASEAAAAGVSVGDIGTTVRAAFEGIVPTSVKKLEEEIDVRVSLTKKERESGQTLTSLKIPNRLGNLIPISRVATITKSQGLAEYEHEDNERQIKVQGDVDNKKTTSRAINNEIRKMLPELNAQFPKTEIAFGGEDKDTNESLQSLAQAFAVAVMGVLLLLVLTFRQLLQPLLIFAVTIPLGMVSCVWAFKIHNMPLTFLGLMGVISLAGVIVNNAIVYVTFVNIYRSEGQDRFESLISAGKTRLRPVFLTTMTTAVGLMPTSYGIGGLDPFVTYITVALSWGLLIGSGLILIFLPAALALLDDARILVAGWLGHEIKNV